MDISVLKKTYIFSLCALILLSCHGLTINFIPLGYTTKPLLLVYLLLSLTFVLPLFILDFKGVVIRKRSLFGKIFTFMFLMILAVGISWGIIHFSLPSIYTELFGKEYSNVLTIKKKHYETPAIRSLRCRYTVATHKFEKKLCVSQELFYNLYVGEEIILTGKISKLGMLVKNIIGNNAEKSF